MTNKEFAEKNIGKKIIYWNLDVVSLLEEKITVGAKFPHVCPKCKSPAYIGFSSLKI